MPKINLSNGKPLPSSDELNELLNSVVAEMETTDDAHKCTDVQTHKCTDVQISKKPKKIERESIHMDVPKGYKKKWMLEAIERDTTLTGLIIEAMDKYLNE